MTIATVTMIGWISLVIGILLACSTLFFDFEGFETLSIGCFVTVFGGSSLILATMTERIITVILFSLLLAILLTLLVHFYVVPMKKTEASLSFSLDKLKGATGEVITAIPKEGMGEILIQTGLSVHNGPAVSYNQEAIAEGSKVLIIEIEDNVFYVSKVEENN